MKTFRFRDWSGNLFTIKAKDRWEAVKIAKKEIAVEHFIINDVKILQHGV